MDTLKQRYLQHKISQAGEERNWREVLTALRKSGYSTARMAMHLNQQYGVTVDASSLSAWLKQAEAQGGLPNKRQEVQNRTK